MWSTQVGKVLQRARIIRRNFYEIYNFLTLFNFLGICLNSGRVLVNSGYFFMVSIIQKLYFNKHKQNQIILPVARAVQVIDKLLPHIDGAVNLL